MTLIEECCDCRIKINKTMQYVLSKAHTDITKSVKQILKAVIIFILRLQISKGKTKCGFVCSFVCLLVGWLVCLFLCVFLN